MAKPIKGIPPAYGEFLACIVLHMLIPLLPLIIETWKTKFNPSEATMVITASMYSVSIGLSSRNKASFSYCFFVSILLSMAFGLVTASQAPGALPSVQGFSLLVIGSVFVIHACERYNRHVVESLPFWDFKEGE